MAATANHSSSGTDDAAAALNSPQSKRGVAAAATRSVASPRTQVVRGAESESIVSSSSSSSSSGAGVAGMAPSSESAAMDSSSLSLSLRNDSVADGQLESSDNGAGNGNAAKKPAWNKPSNGASEVGPVMGAASWPALSESTRVSPKPSSSDSVKSLSDGSTSASQGSGSSTSSTQKQVIPNNTNHIVTPNHVTPQRQKPMKRSGGNSAVSEPPSRDHAHKEGGHKGGFGSQSHSGSDHPPQRNTFRRGNGGHHARGDGSYHQNYGGRRDQDRLNHEWNSQGAFGGRDAHVQSQRVVPRPFIRPPPPGSAQFIPSPVPMRPFGSPMIYHEGQHPVFYVTGPPPDSYRAMPFMSPISPPAMFFPVPDPQLPVKILNQIDYYFSNENLIKDTYLREKMDDQGWVSIKLIATFKKVSQLTDNIQLILDALHASTVVEVQGDKVRRRNEWSRWLMPPSVQGHVVSGPRSLGTSSSSDKLAANIQGVSLEEQTSKQGGADAFHGRLSSGDLCSPSQQTSGERTGQARRNHPEEVPSPRSSSQ
ncbi:la-related protein 1C isoform X2 [Diospyros lotus]|uniref:la-related protein 1C isoform X2 n=1 Tax=Diospyros lotus TaxID=55363 RepID=UPI00224FACFD|nr:la-related protein 1C isoform X2 [Diospyros lotus]